MLRILSEGAFRKVSEQLLSLLSKYVHVNTLFVALNDGITNQIVQAYNRTEKIVTEGSLPYKEAYCSHVCNHDSDVLIIEDTSKSPITANMKVTSVIGSGTFIGIPITLKSGSRVGTVCGMDRETHVFTEPEIEILQGAAAFLAYAIELENAVNRDPITGTYTRRYVEKVYEKWLPEHPHITALMLSTGKVELFNKIEGCEVGEYMLRAVAKRVQDSIHPDDILARVSDTEFVVLTYRAAGTESILNLAQEILQRFIAPLEVNDRIHFLSIRIGIASTHERSVNIQHLLKSAAIALYSSFLQSRNPIAFYYPEEEAVISRRIEISNRLHFAIESGEFHVQYQPKFGIQNGIYFSSTEALIRWKSRDGQWISPVEFIPVAEDSGLIKHVGRFVLLEACRQNKA